jgi:2-oxoglutarate dehydrogenase E1 component
MEKHSYLSNSSLEFMDDEYKRFLRDPEGVEFGWRKFFEGFEFRKEEYGDMEVPESFRKEFQVLNLISSYRQRGHLFTVTNPVRERRKYSPTLDIENFGLSEADLDTVFNAGVEIGIGPSSLRDIVAHLETTYCKSLGVEYSYIRNPEKFEWLRNRMESSKNQPNFSAKEKKYILNKLNHAVEFEQFLHKKFVQDAQLRHLDLDLAGRELRVHVLGLAAPHAAARRDHELRADVLGAGVRLGRGIGTERWS